MLEITAAVTETPEGRFHITKVTLDKLREHEVLVKIAGVGICHTDITMKARVAFNPGVLGHEGAGIVEKVGTEVKTLKPGDKVVLSYYACHDCRNCNADHGAYCENGRIQNYSGSRADGSKTIFQDQRPIASSFFSQSSFATYAIAHENNAVKVETSLPLHTLGPLGCGILTGAGSVINALKVKPGDGIAIFGAGAVGLSAVMAAKDLGAKLIVVVDLVKERLSLAKQLGATHVIKGDEKNAVEEIQAVSNGGIDFSLECVGNPRLLAQAVECLRPTGTCGLLGLCADEQVQAPISMNTILRGRTLVGLIEGDSDPHQLIPYLIKLNEAGRFPFEKLQKVYPFYQINEAVADMESGRVIKPVLVHE